MATRTRKFCAITYLNQFQIIKCLTEHINQIRAYAFIYHDKDTYTEEDVYDGCGYVVGDLKQPHYHLIVITYNACTVSAVKRWFGGYIDKNGSINTNVQLCNDIYAYDDYLCHEDKKSIAEGKFHYNRDNVVYSNRDFFKANECCEYDNSLLAAEMLLKGVPLRTVGKIFGKDIIYHYSQIKQYVNDVQVFEKHNIKDFGQLLDYQTFGNVALFDNDDVKI